MAATDKRSARRVRQAEASVPSWMRRRRSSSIPTPARVRPLDELGVQPAAKEALEFALLAHRTLAGLPGNVVGATGAAHPVVLGTITPGGCP